MSSYEISKSSLLSLKAEILRKKQDLIKAKADNEVKIKIIKKNTPLEIKNRGIETRLKNDITEEEQDLLKQSRSVLEAKSKLYDKLSSGKLTKSEIEHKKRFLVRFDKKNSDIGSPPPIDFEDSEPDECPESDDSHYHTDEDETDKDPGEKWVDYTDCLGRTRKCLQKDLEYLMSKDEELKKTVDVKNKSNSLNEGESDNPVENTEKKDEDVNKNSPKDDNDKNEISNQESEMLSNDMRRELLRQQWEKEEDELRNKANVHYQDILFGEARTHGVGYYGFSKDEEERVKQQEALKRLRIETEEKHRKAQELKAIREKQLAARIKAAKDRRRVRLGLPPEEDTEPVAPQPEVSLFLSEEEKRKQEELKRKDEEKQKLLEEARKKHLRPWDIGKEGVKEHYEMTQEEWVEKKRDERPEEFAPPQAYKGRKFRSVVEKSQLEDTNNKSLRFTTKKLNKKSRNNTKKIKRADHPETANTEMSQQERLVISTDVDKISDTPNNYQTLLFKQTPIENLCGDTDFDDHLLADFNKAMYGKEEYVSSPPSDRVTNNTNRGRGVEIAPPPTMDYYGSSASKRPKLTKESVDIESSIEAGLKFLRKQVEEKQKPTRHRNDYSSPF